MQSPNTDIYVCTCQGGKKPCIDLTIPSKVLEHSHQSNYSSHTFRALLPLDFAYNPRA